jgi:cystathionine gamma-lyase
MTAFGPSTRSVHAGSNPAPGQAFLQPPALAAPYHLDPRGPQPGADGYGRTDNASWRALEAAIGELEGGPCAVFASGMAAIAALLFTTLRSGDTVVLPGDGYYKTRQFARTRLTPLGVNVVEAPTAGPYPSFTGVRLVLLETPSNPGLDVVDIADIAGAAHACGALVAVDNTTATPLGQQPLALGADFSVASGTKALTGHSDMLLGYVCAGADVDDVTAWRGETGAIVGGFEAWLARRSLATLDLRLSRQSANALAVATMLAARQDVADVRHPGLDTDPSHPVAAAQMVRMPGLVTFTLPSPERVAAFLEKCTLVSAATSFGGLHTSADRRAQWGDPVPAGLLRLSCGIEDTDDLVADIAAALDASAS